ncbi:MAG TPA: LysM peptidoglycan-binding domain-containing protein, partial [Chloroflexota bacterium]
MLSPAGVQAATNTYIVQPGDTLSGIAAVTGAHVGELISLNGIDQPNAIVAGTVLQLPVTPNSVSPPSGQSTYTVAVGDTLSGIASSEGVSLQLLVYLNGLPDGDHIEAGMVLMVPGPPLPAPVVASPIMVVPPLPSPTSPPPAASTYVVIAGDTLFGIALHYGVSLADLIALNGLDGSDFIMVGDLLRVPATTTPLPAAIPSITATLVLGSAVVASPTPAPTRSAAAAIASPTAAPTPRPLSAPRGIPIISPVPTPGIAVNPATLPRAAQIALQYRGARYVSGGVTPDGFD